MNICEAVEVNTSHFESILRMTQPELKEHLAQQLREQGYEPVCKSGFLYAEGTVPVLLVAHLDTVHAHHPDIICRSEDGRYWMSPYGIGGDDRAGVYMILLLMRECHCHILFCEDEEIGGVGARKFAKSKLHPEVSYIVELDRRGTNDAVFYNCDNPDFTEFVCSFGFKENHGSFSDISVIAPYLKTAAVNISAGFFNEHRLHEMIDTHAMCKNVRRLAAIRSGKSHIQKSLSVWKLELERYTGLVQQIKEKRKERKALIAEKKDLPVYRVKRHKALTVRIAELTEDLEELRSEKALLLQKFEYAEDTGAEAFRKDIATMEAGLKKVEAQEQKYSAELDKVLAEYAELKAQAVDLDPVELYKARQAIRPAQEKEVEQQLEDTTQEKPSLIMLLSAKQEASHLLGEDAEERQARQMIMRRKSTEQLKRSHLKTDRCKIER